VQPTRPRRAVPTITIRPRGHGEVHDRLIPWWGAEQIEARCVRDLELR
jgi:hypothetical protein